MRVLLLVGPYITELPGDEGERVKVIIEAGPPGGEIRTVCDGFLTVKGELVTPPGAEWDERNPTVAGR